MTVEARQPAFDYALSKYFDGELDKRTIAIIGRDSTACG